MRYGREGSCVVCGAYVIDRNVWSNNDAADFQRKSPELFPRYLKFIIQTFIPVVIYDDSKICAYYTSIFRSSKLEIALTRAKHIDFSTSSYEVIFIFTFKPQIVRFFLTIQNAKKPPFNSR